MIASDCPCLLGQEMHSDSDGGPEWGYKQEGEQQSLRKLQARGNLAGIPGCIGRVISPIEFGKPVETPHILATIQ